jgi:hypothetical protein
MSEQLQTHEQLQLAIAEARTGADGQPQTSEQLIEHIISLYGAEFVKANQRIADLEEGFKRQQLANDNLFRIKQKTVIANNDLKRKLAQIAQLFALRQLTTKALNEIMAGVEEDLLWRFHNDAGFHQFVQRICAEMLARHGERELRDVPP